MTEYTLIRSDRRTIGLQLTREGGVVVRAPRRTSRALIDAFVESKADWIEKNRRALLAQNAQRDGFSLKEGDRLTLCGETLRVELRPGLRPALLPGRLLLPTGKMDAVRGDILRLARTHKRPWLEERLELWAGRMGVTYRALRLSSARCRWGSCASDGTIRISVFLLFAPERAIDYVLVHELAHRRHFDHSRAFWAEVETFMPDYRTQKQVLREFQREPLIQSLAK